MPETSSSAIVAYVCECGKKWTFPKKNTTGKRSTKCECGRTIVIEEGIIYGTAKETARSARSRNAAQS